MGYLEKSGMNEKIKQLALQAGGFYASGFKEVGSEFCLVDDDIQKFAELIVEECIKISKDSHWTWFKQHLGIEK
jgi:hypothetical protein